MSRAAVLEEALAHGTQLVEVTGGEPLLQAGVLPLMRELCDAGRTVLLETSGERDVSEVDPRVHKIMDLKAPGSAECHRNCFDNLALLTTRDEVKFVLTDRTDYEWMRTIIAEHDMAEGPAGLLASCVFGQLTPRQLVAWVLEDELPVRVQLQMHKYIWDSEATGV